MSYYADIDPYVIMERNQQIRREVQALHLEGRLRKNREAHASRLPPSIKQGKHIIGGVRLSH